MPQKTQDILDKLHKLTNQSSDINTYLFKLNALIIQNNISDKTVLADPANKVASWNIGCGGYWVVKSSLTKLEKPRKRGRESSSATEEDRSEMERLQIAQAVLESLHQKGFELIFLQEGPSTEYLAKNPAVNAQGLGLKNTGESGQICCYASPSPSVTLASAFSKQAESLVKEGQSLGLLDKEYQIIETAQGQIYVNVHMEWLYTPGTEGPKAKYIELQKRMEFLEAATACGIVLGDTNIEKQDYAKLVQHIHQGYVQLNGGCSTIDILAGENIGPKLTEGSSPLPPPDVYSPAPEDFYEYEEGQSSSMRP